MNITKEQREIMEECLAGGDEANLIYVVSGSERDDTCYQLCCRALMKDKIDAEINSYALTKKGISELQRLQADEKKESESVLAASGMKGSAAGAKMREDSFPKTGRTTEDLVEGMRAMLSLAGIGIPTKNKPEHSEQERIIDGLATVARKLFDEKEKDSQENADLKKQMYHWHKEHSVVEKENKALSKEIEDLNEEKHSCEENVKRLRLKWFDTDEENKSLKRENKAVSSEIEDLKEHIFALLLERKEMEAGRTGEVRRWYARSCELKKENAELKAEIEKLKGKIPVEPDREESQFIKAAEAGAELSEKILRLSLGCRCPTNPVSDRKIDESLRSAGKGRVLTAKEMGDIMSRFEKNQNRICDWLWSPTIKNEKE